MQIAGRHLLIMFMFTLHRNGAGRGGAGLSPDLQVVASISAKQGIITLLYPVTPSLHQHHKTGPPIDGHNFYCIPFSPTFNVGSLSVVKLMRWSFKIRNPQEPSSQRLDTNIPILGRSIIMQGEGVQQRQFEQEIVNTSTFWIFRGQVLSTLTCTRPAAGS